MRLSETMKKIPILSSADIVAGVDSDSINCKHFHDVSFDLIFGSSYSGASGAVVKLFEGATAGDMANALTFNYRYTGGQIKAADADVLSDWATSAALQIATATLLSRLLVIEIDTAAMETGVYSWLTIEIGNESDAGELSILATCTPRYGSMAGKTALT